MQGELRELEQQLGIAQQQHAQHEEAVKKVEVAKYGLQCVEQEAASSAGHKAQQQADELEAQLKEQQERHAAALEKANAAEEKAKVCDCVLGFLGSVLFCVHILAGVWDTLSSCSIGLRWRVVWGVFSPDPAFATVQYWSL